MGCPTLFSSRLLLVYACLMLGINGQYQEGTSKYQQKKSQGEEDLLEEIQAHEDLKEYFYPEQLYEDVDVYRTEIPLSQEYTIGIMVFPCGDNSTNDGSYIVPFDCCQNIYGDGEYGYLTDEATEQYGLQYPSYRQARSDLRQPARANEVSENILLFDDRRQLMDVETSRRADDEIVVDEECTGRFAPFPYCMGVRMKKIQYSQMAACMDNNETVKAMLPCYDLNGALSPHCMQVAYSQSSFIHVCGGEFTDNDHCGTFLEVHRQNGSPYDPEETILSDTKITTRETSGMVTTTLSLSYKGDPTKILCEFGETVIRVGSMVLIKEQAPTCCCPQGYNTKAQVGRFECPRSPTGPPHGPFAVAVNTLEKHRSNDEGQSAYPFCPNLDENIDQLLCSKQASKGFSQDTYIDAITRFDTQMRFYSEPCAPVNYTKTAQMWTSPDLQSSYPNPCVYFESCALQDTVCFGFDAPFTFSGYVGKVVSIPDNLEDPNALYHVTFNNGRTSYPFLLTDMEMMEPDYNYELWFVQRTPYDFVIQQRKPFKVVSPKCTYDIVNQRYFPYAQLDENSAPMNQADGGFDGNEAPRNFEDPVVFYQDDGARRTDNGDEILDLDK